MDDAISYMTCLADFAAAFRTASAHLNPGGVLVATPDVTTETFRQNKTIATPATRTGTRDELDVVFVENVYDPDPADEQYETTILYLIRDHGRLRIETDHWTMGLFSLDTWRRVLRETGFEVHEGRYNAGEDRVHGVRLREDEMKAERRVAAGVAPATRLNPDVIHQRYRPAGDQQCPDGCGQLDRSQSESVAGCLPRLGLRRRSAVHRRDRSVHGVERVNQSHAFDIRKVAHIYDPPNSADNIERGGAHCLVRLT